MKIISIVNFGPSTFNRTNDRPPSLVPFAIHDRSLQVKRPFSFPRLTILGRFSLILLTAHFNDEAIFNDKKVSHDDHELLLRAERQIATVTEKVDRMVGEAQERFSRCQSRLAVLYF